MTEQTFGSPWQLRQAARQQDATQAGSAERRRRRGHHGHGLRGQARRHLQERLAAPGYSWVDPGDSDPGEGGRGDGRGGRGGGRGRGGNPFGGNPFGGNPFGPPGFGGPGFGPGPFGNFGRGRRGGGRARRGDVRAAALILLGEEPRNGYQLIQELANRSDGLWKPSPGAVYPALQQLEDEGLIQSTADGRKAWELTPAGREYLEANRQQFGTPWELAGNDVSDGIRGLAELGAQVGAAVMQVAHAGDDEQLAKAAQILSDTRRSLYRLLAGDEPTA